MVKKGLIILGAHLHCALLVVLPPVGFMCKKGSAKLRLIILLSFRVLVR